MILLFSGFLPTALGDPHRNTVLYWDRLDPESPAGKTVEISIKRAFESDSPSERNPDKQLTASFPHFPATVTTLSPALSTGETRPTRESGAFLSTTGARVGESEMVIFCYFDLKR